MLWLDRKYVGMVKPYLQLPQDAGELLLFRCPYCGDSKKKKFKRRGYLIPKPSGYYFYCHNCSASRSMNEFLKEQSPQLHRDYVMEIIADKKESEPEPVETPVSEPALDHIVVNRPSVLSLPKEHAAVAYLTKRKIAVRWWQEILYTESWANDINSSFPQKVHWKYNSRPALVFIARKNGKVLGAQARFMDGDGQSRYMTASFSETPLIWGMDHIDPKKKTYVLEGVFDAMSIDNAVSCLGSHVSKAIMDEIPNPVFVPDNEPRNAEVMQHLSDQIDDGREVVIWPDGLRCKDVNEMLGNGRDVLSLLEKNTKSDLLAKVAFAAYTKS